MDWNIKSRTITVSEKGRELLKDILIFHLDDDKNNNKLIDKFNKCDIVLNNNDMAVLTDCLVMETRKHADDAELGFIDSILCNLQ